MAQYDLTQTIGAHLDRHLVFPLLEFLKAKQVYSEQDLFAGQLQLLSNTNMVDFAMDIYQKLHQTEPPQEMKKKRETVVARLRELDAKCAPLRNLLDDAALVQRLQEEKLFNWSYLQKQYNIQANALEALYDHAKFQYECGNYSGAALYLSHFRSLSSDPEKNFSALWGKLAAEILKQNWNEANEDLKVLKEAIETKTFKSPLMRLQQRTWLLHWSLFVFFNSANGRTGIIDLFFNEKYLNTIQMTCPHVLRYLTTAVITNRRKRGVLKELVDVIQQESYTYKDPITEFVEDLYVKFDFDGAQQKLRQCEDVLLNDFFLVSCRAEFIENARLLIFETYCRIHQRIDLGMLAEKLNMDQEAAERWIVNMIRNARLDAKIDSASNQIVMGSQYPSVHQQVIEKTKGLSFRSSVLANSLQRYLTKQ
ncbi:Eukaryotic translation initiation factor 3 subunit E [Balamuthia mandrillaris]